MRAVILAFVIACGDNAAPPDAGPQRPIANLARDVVDTKLAFDVTLHTGAATITLAPSTMPGGSLEIGDLAIHSVEVGGVPLPFDTANGAMRLGLPASDTPIAIDLAYTWANHEMFTGASRTGYTLTWPYYCGNLFPCHSQPADGTTFSLSVAGVPGGHTAVFPATIASPAPAYQIAWTIDAYTELPLGATAAGTRVSVWYRPNELAAATAGTQHLVAAFDWFERTFGPYRFGPTYASASVGWPPGAFGGMEHHPIVHIAGIALGDEPTHVHEAAHGWFGDGIRLQCWEDFVLSEGTVSYLEAHVLDVIAPAIGATVWQNYTTELGGISPTAPVWPQSCGTVDILKSKLNGRAPYIRGAFFYKAVADKVGAAMLDRALAAFYAAHAGGAARMADMLDTIRTVTGYDPAACAAMWLGSTTIPAIAPCP